MTIWWQVAQVQIQLVPEDKRWSISILQFLVWKVEWPCPSSWGSVQIIKCSEWSPAMNCFWGFRNCKWWWIVSRKCEFFFNKAFASLLLFFIVEFQLIFKSQNQRPSFNLLLDILKFWKTYLVFYSKSFHAKGEHYDLYWFILIPLGSSSVWLVF